MTETKVHSNFEDRNRLTSLVVPATPKSARRNLRTGYKVCICPSTVTLAESRELKIMVAYDTMKDDAITKRDQVIQKVQKANARYENEAEKPVVEKDDKLSELRREVRDRLEKEKEFGLTLRDLNVNLSPDHIELFHILSAPIVSSASCLVICAIFRIKLTHMPGSHQGQGKTSIQTKSFISSPLSTTSLPRAACKP